MWFPNPFQAPLGTRLWVARIKKEAKNQTAKPQAKPRNAFTVDVKSSAKIFLVLGSAPLS